MYRLSLHKINYCKDYLSLQFLVYGKIKFLVAHVFLPVHGAWNSTSAKNFSGFKVTVVALPIYLKHHVEGFLEIINGS